MRPPLSRAESLPQRFSPAAMLGALLFVTCASVLGIALHRALATPNSPAPQAKDAEWLDMGQIGLDIRSNDPGVAANLKIRAARADGVDLRAALYSAQDAGLEIYALDGGRQSVATIVDRGDDKRRLVVNIKATDGQIADRVEALLDDPE